MSYRCAATSAVRAATSAVRAARHIAGAGREGRAGGPAHQWGWAAGGFSGAEQCAMCAS